MWTRLCSAVLGTAASSYEGGGVGTDSDSGYYTPVTSQAVTAGPLRAPRLWLMPQPHHQHNTHWTWATWLKTRSDLPLSQRQIHVCLIHKVLVLSQLNCPQRSKHSVPWLATEVLDIVHQSSMETNRVKQLNTRPYSRLKRKWKILTTDHVYHCKVLPGSGHCPDIW